MFQALIPVLEKLHPMTIVNQAHAQSISAVEANNTLKKERYMYWHRYEYVSVLHVLALV